MSLSRRQSNAGGATVLPRAAAICVSSTVLIASIGLGLAGPALAASMIVSAGLSGGAGTANVGGVEYAKSGAAMTLTVVTDTTARCVKLTGAHSGSSSSPTASDPTSETWTFALTALAGADGPRNTTVTASLDPACGTSDATTTASYTVDNTPPTVTATKSPPNNSHGWNNTAVTITWSAADSGSGVASGPTPASATQTTNTGGTNKTSTATDRVGNVGSGSTIVKVDLTPPTITANENPAPNANGWNNTNVTVSFTCADGQSGIETCSPAQSFTTNVSGVVTTGTALDFASNTTSTSVTVNVDKNAPTISGTPAGSPNAAGWYNSDVDIVWSCSDTGGSGFATGACADSTISTEGTGLTASKSVSDLAGNSSAVATSSPAVNLDKTPPATTATTAVSGGGSVVTFTLTATDALSGVQATKVELDGGPTQTYDPSNPPTFSTQGDHTFEFWSLDNADNVESHHVSSFTIDTVAPTITIASAPAANSDGWNSSDVTVTFTCSDAVSGVAICPAPVVVSTEGANQPVSGTAFDKAGNSASASTSVSIDKTAPAVTASAVPAANSNGWNNSAVTVTFTCSDGLSGVATCPAAEVVSTESANQPVSGTAVDNAGNSGTATTTVSLDKTAPTVTASAAPAANSSGWNNTAVVVTFTCADGLSGVAACAAAQTVSSEGIGQSAAGSSTDVAGNSASASLGSINIDLTAPAVSVVGVVDGGSYVEGAWSASCSTSDALSGVATAASLSTSGGPTGTVTVTCAGAADVAGNGQTAPVSVQITVTAPVDGGPGPFHFGGFQRPVAAGLNIVSAGSAVPLKFSLGGYQGMAIFAAGFPASASYTCGATPPTSAGEPTMSIGGLTYDASSDTYTYVWRTLKAWTGCRVLQLRFSDGSVATALFSFR